jgi:hypothetical protein
MDKWQVFLDILPISISFLIGAATIYLKFNSDKKKLQIEKEKIELEKEKYKHELEEANKLALHKEYRVDFFKKIHNLQAVDRINLAVENIFNKTKADRFLILVAVNGKDYFKEVSVVYEKHKDNPDLPAKITYKEIRIDEHYTSMLKHVESEEQISLSTKLMQECLLRSFYEIEDVKHSKVMFLGRQEIDKDNDFVVFCSIATHLLKPYNNHEKVIIKTNKESLLKPAIEEILEE